MEAWTRFKQDYQPEIISMEDELKCHTRFVLGHADLKAKIAGVVRRVDFKTSGSVRKHHWLQLGGYELLDPVGSSAILRLDRNIGTYEFLTNEVAGYEMAYLANLYANVIGLYDFHTERAYGTGGNDDSNIRTEDSPTDAKV